MKRLTILLMVVMAACAAGLAQEKVIDRSAKKAPEWIATHPEGYLVVTVNAPTLAEAQTRVMDEVRTRIIQSVATNVSSLQDFTIENVTNSQDVSTTERLTSVTRVAAANLPFLQGVSEAKIDGSYWECFEDKTNKTLRYSYTVRYPFSELERSQLINDFNALEQEKSGKLSSLEALINNIEAASQIKESLAQLDELEAYFFDAPRLAQVSGLRGRYKALYNDISLSSETLDTNEFLLSFTLAGRPLKVSTVPKVTSKSGASQIKVVPKDGAFLITCDTQDCLPEEENTLDVAISIDGKRLKHTIYLE